MIEFFISNSLEKRKEIETFLYVFYLQYFSQDYNLASHTTHVKCVHFTRKRLDLKLNFEKLFHGKLIYSQRFYQQSAERKSLKIYFQYFLFIFCFDA